MAVLEQKPENYTHTQKAFAAKVANYFKIEFGFMWLKDKLKLCVVIEVLASIVIRTVFFGSSVQAVWPSFASKR